MAPKCGPKAIKMNKGNPVSRVRGYFTAAVFWKDKEVCVLSRIHQPAAE
jgi:hypothetical protein